MSITLALKKQLKTIRHLSVIVLFPMILSCHKSPGAICNDGHRSYSTGRGTCSWHGGIRYTIDTNEISIPKTIGLIIIIFFIGSAFITGNSKK